MDFYYTDNSNFHLQRRKEIIEKYPEVKELMGPNSKTAIYIFGLGILQFSLSYLFRDLSWWMILILAYILGAFISHALYVLIHECCHNMVFKTSNANKIMGIICDLSLGFPSALTFREYHMMHHRNLNEDPGDPDVVSKFEGRLIGNSVFKKLLWVTFFMVSQGLRPLKMKNVSAINGWTISNFLIVVTVDILVFKFIGPMALFYLMISTFIGLGLHPLGGRWVQEHYITKEDQETYSYYGPLNKVCFYMGYHNEHHDLINVPWNNLPKLKKIAPEYYDNLKSYNSWVKVLLNFIFNPKMGPFSKLIHLKSA
jgi:sphingolipid 4-desaturase/C4-monooxygenase